MLGRAARARPDSVAGREDADRTSCNEWPAVAGTLIPPQAYPQLRTRPRADDPQAYAGDPNGELNLVLLGRGTLVHESSDDAPEPRRRAAVPRRAGFFFNGDAVASEETPKR